MLYRQFKRQCCGLFTVLVVLLVLSACKAGNNHKVMDQESIRVGNEEYTREEMRGYLSHIWQAEKLKDYPFTRWKGDGYEIVYELNVTDDLDKDRLQVILDERMAYFAERTGLTFRKPKRDTEYVHMHFFLGTDLGEMKQNKNILLLKDSEDESHRQFYGNLKDDNDKHSFYKAYSGNIEGVERPYALMSISVMVYDFFGENENSVDSLFATDILYALCSIQNLKYLGMAETVTTKLMKTPPYIWPLDGVILDLIYQGEVNYSGVRRSEVIEHLLDEMTKRSQGEK